MTHPLRNFAHRNFKCGFILENLYVLCSACIVRYNKNSAEVDIEPAFGEITTACNVGQAKKGHGVCLKSGQLVYARFHPHSQHCCKEINFISRLNVNFLDDAKY